MKPNSEQMHVDWDRRARENAEHFVQSEKRNWDDAEFFRSGEINVANDVMPDMHRICGGSRSPRELTMVEIGCGVGRMTRMLAALFGTVIAVDVSAEMIAKAETKLSNLPNVLWIVNDGQSLASVATCSVDFVFSFIVFQHIPSKSIIQGYFRDAYRVLKPGAIFKVQVNGGSPETATESTVDTWEGARYSLDESLLLSKDTGFTVEYYQGEGTQYLWLCLRKPWHSAADV